MACPANPLYALLAHSLSYAGAFVVVACIAIGLDVFATRAARLGASADTARLIELGGRWFFRADVAMVAALLATHAARFIWCQF